MRSIYPRVLLVSADGIGAETGTGITLRNLFSEWPADSLAQVQLSAASRDSNVPLIQYPRTATPVDAIARALLNLRKHKRTRGVPPIAGVPLPADAAPEVRAHANVRALLDLSPVMYSRTVARFTDDFRPDLIYSLLGSSRVIRIATRLCTRHRIPLVPHFMDDWAASLYTSNELDGRARKRLMQQLETALRLAPVALCISDPMAEEYRNRFGMPCEAFANPVPISPSPTGGKRQNSALDLVYAGGLHLGRWNVLLRLAEALHAEGVKARLTVYSPDGPELRGSIPSRLTEVLVVANPLHHAAVADRLRQATALVHVESFDPATVRYTELSVSTKIPQYLMAGRPILAVGPATQASMQVVTKSAAGLVIADSSLSALRAGCSDFVRRAKYFDAMGVAGRTYAITNFGEVEVRTRLLKVLTEAQGGLTARGVFDER